MLPASDTRSLAFLYHLNSAPSLAGEDYEVSFARPIEGGHSRDQLTLPNPGNDALLGLIRRRRSCRQFDSRTLSQADLALLLAGTYGPGEPLRVVDGIEVESRTVPSAGALYPLELYAHLERVDGIDDGLYRY